MKAQKCSRCGGYSVPRRNCCALCGYHTAAPSSVRSDVWLDCPFCGSPAFLTVCEKTGRNVGAETYCSGISGECPIRGQYMPWRLWNLRQSNAQGESRAIERTLDPIVGNLDSEVTR